MRFKDITIIGLMLTMILVAGCQVEVPEEEPLDLGTYTGGDYAEKSRTKIEVSLQEWSITFSEMEADAGLVNFVVTNNGNYYEEFMVEGNGVSVEVEDGIRAGGRATLEVELEAGTYTLSSPIPGRVEKGMVAQLVVS